MRALPRSLLLAGLLVWLTACVPHWLVQGTRTPALDLDGPMPDVVVIGISGRCSQPCLAPRDNRDYLSSRGTLDSVADVFSSAGFAVEVAGYASHPAASHTSPYLPRPQPGFEALLADFTRLHDTWLKQPQPPRIIVVAHSHGVTWAHLLTRTFPDVPITAQVDLDGMCVAWRPDYSAAVRALPPTAPQRTQMLDACDPIQIGGRKVPLKDVVWPNVAVNYEVQSKRLPARTSASGGLPVNYLFELSRNTRLDGTTSGIERFVSVREDHSSITYPNSDAMAWVTTHLRELIQSWPAPTVESTVHPVPVDPSEVR
ncbi:hypothetical protein E7T09_05860 [Deinococcus sp. KSM4-11]|uniref:hypothetical protein n=1 Tax=Deinococcus sp. KSM4-11 TaxID=2568654 RepID=UPI0010A53E89|nr:hypothetical protein [Deinococcus sp. KSM4-11]THF88701.1 hypothetical protein E7T09_05860 [Deinococcus sp. KSM4-11]